MLKPPLSSGLYSSKINSLKIFTNFSSSTIYNVRQIILLPQKKKTSSLCYVFAVV